MIDQNRTPLYEALIKNKQNNPMSFHVPGHKYGRVFPSRGKEEFAEILSIDATEIAGLDDLHAPEEVIDEAQKLTSDYFKSDHSFFLVNGTTVGNLAMVLSVCVSGDVIIVQRNCHKSVLHGIELAGAKPVFLTPEFEEETNRYSAVTSSTVRNALEMHPDAKAVFLTYPDYFGRTYPLAPIIEEVHHHDIPVLIDEAHGVHFQIGKPFPDPSLSEGVDAVVQSAHKMAPAMTMASFLHLKGGRIDVSKVRYYLQLLQSSSPSYPLLASLDLARYFLAQWTEQQHQSILTFVKDTREIFEKFQEHWRVLPMSVSDDPLKITLETKRLNGFELAQILEEIEIHPELATSQQVLLTLGLQPSMNLALLEEQLYKVDSRLKNGHNRATIKVDQVSFPEIQTLEMSYSDMQRTPAEMVDWHEAVGYVSADAVIPYPPGIPLLMKGERISSEHLEQVRLLLEQGARFQNVDMDEGIRVFKGELT